MLATIRHCEDFARNPWCAICEANFTYTCKSITRFRISFKVRFYLVDCFVAPLLAMAE
ncbi:hypothetical protein [Helicobacter sp. MIT 05-5294]|uniref:hypothetical protein n=1 Tax=Helicobacter sp. MIT 05-5294 TaxID=1548150 RepID=UPI0018843240|nr:hypothetical protein [Helicobacter sp. MIT 05-5294]